MALSLTWTRTKSIVQQFPGLGSAGARIISSGEVIAALRDSNVSPEKQVFFASSDSGATWTQRSSLPMDSSVQSSRWIHWPTNICCYCSTDEDQRDLFVWRSTDGGANWSIVYTLAGPGPGAYLPFCTGAVTWARSAGAFVGQLQRQPTGVHSAQLIYTTDKGVNWTNYGLVTPTAVGMRIDSLAAKPGGILLVGAGPNTAYIGNPTSSFTTVGTLPNPGGSFNAICWDSSWLTDAVGVLVGYDNFAGPPYEPAVWYSIDSGSSWTRVAAADIVNWPTTGFFRPGTRTAERLTRDAVAMGLYKVNGAVTSPVVISQDQGQTYPFAGTGWTYGINTGIGDQGSMVTTKDGYLIAVADVSGGGETRSEIWRGKISC